MSQTTEEKDFFTAKNLIDIFKANWLWFVLSIVVCVGLAGVYILCKAPTYTRNTQLLIKEEEAQWNSIGNFSGIDLFNQPSNMYNEINVIKSPDIMQEVVKRLDLNNTYLTNGTFHKISLYGAAIPVNIYVNSVDTTKSVSFKVEFENDKSFEITKFKLGKDRIKSEPVKGTIGQSTKTPVGDVVITKNPSFKDIEEFPYPIYFTHTTTYACARSYIKRLVVNAVDNKASVIEVSISDVSTKRADDILKVLIEEYNKAWAADKTQVAINTSYFLRERLAAIENELKSVDTDISSFKSSNLLPDIGAASDLYMRRANDANARLLELNNQLYMAKYVKDYMATMNNTQTLPANSGFESAGLSQLISNYNQKVIERNNLVSVSSESNPAVRDMDNALANMRTAILSSIDNQIVTLENQIRTTSNYEVKAVNHIASNPEQEKYLLSVERQQKVKESLYLFLLQKLEENELTNSYAGSNNRVIVKPGGEGIPTSPRTKVILFAALLMGIILPYAIVFMRQRMTTTITGRDDLMSVTMPFLGEIPLNKKGQRRPLKQKFFARKDAKNEETPILVSKGNRNIINEAFRLIRTNLEMLLGKETNKNVFTITSFNPGSGKSFITMNLATVLTFKDKRVLVIDCDLRHGSTSQYVDSPSTGIVDYLNGKITDLNKVIVPYPDNANLNIIPIGKIPPNPTELLESERFEEVISDVRDKYDYIFLDCPPIDIVADTQIVERLSDRTIFIVRAGLLDKVMVPELQKLYTTHSLKNMSLILNGTHMTSTRYYSYGNTSYYVNK